ncbi:MAG TPA: hypothetical protein VMN60_13720, partial [Longimicrobiales bacterium]|nr:hypothetical protein [Longimicrobiales bacterium]
MKLRPLHATVIVFAVALALYLPALRNGFAYDDVAVIQGDPRVHSLAHTAAIFTRGYWADADLALYRPLTTLSFAMDWTLSGGKPAWFLFTNALWNATVCALVFAFLTRFAAPAAALGAALLFAVHPVHVEAVANIVGRAELIAGAFTFGALLLWPSTSAPQLARVAGVGLLFALALLTKESAIMLPALLVLIDVARAELTPATARQWLRRRAGGLLMLAGIAGAYLGIRAIVLGGIVPTRLDAALEVTSGVDRVFTALQAWPVYLQLLLMPVVLLADYGPRILMPALGPTPAAIGGAFILAVLTVGGLISWRRGRGDVALALLWLPVTLLPVSNLIIPIGIIVAERTLYVPSLVLALGVALAADRLSLRPPLRLAGAAALALVFVLFAGRTLVRIPEWRSTDSIFAALLRDRPDSFRAHWHHARTASAGGRHDVALERYARALELWPFRR